MSACTVAGCVVELVVEQVVEPVVQLVVELVLEVAVGLSYMDCGWLLHRVLSNLVMSNHLNSLYNTVDH